MWRRSWGGGPPSVTAILPGTFPDVYPLREPSQLTSVGMWWHFRSRREVKKDRADILSDDSSSWSDAGWTFLREPESAFLDPEPWIHAHVVHEIWRRPTICHGGSLKTPGRRGKHNRAIHLQHHSFTAVFTWATLNTIVCNLHDCNGEQRFMKYVLCHHLNSKQNEHIKNNNHCLNRFQRVWSVSVGSHHKVLIWSFLRVCKETLI